MAQRLGRPVAVQRGWDYLQRLKQSRQTPRPRHAREPYDRAQSDPRIDEHCYRVAHQHGEQRNGIISGESRDGGSYDARMGAVACWNAVMDENDYMTRKWNQFIAA